MPTRPPTKRRKREWGLSQAMNHRDSVDDLMEIMTNDPSSARQKDRFDEYPLHVACDDNQYDTVIIKLLDLFPEAAQQMNKKGDYPLHIACRWFYHSEQTMMHLIGVFPEAAAIPDRNHLYPLHLVLLNYDAKIVVIQKLLELHTLALREKCTIKSWYPIHYAIDNKPHEVAILLIEADPMVLRQLHSTDGNLLHFACCRKHKEATVEYLIQRSEILINARDRQGQTPLHYACQLHSGIEMVRILLNHPDCDVNATDCFGNTPLHDIVKHRNYMLWECDMPVVRLLLDHPDIRIYQKNHDNQTPLDLVKMEITRIEAMNSNDVAARTLRTYCTIRDILEEEYPYQRRCRSYDYLLCNNNL